MQDARSDMTIDTMAPTPIPEGKYANVDPGMTLHYHDAGSGEPVIFLHGSGPGASGYSNFKGNYPVFARNGYRAIVPDLPGFGLFKTRGCEYVLDFFWAPFTGWSRNWKSNDVPCSATRWVERSRSSTRSIIPTSSANLS